MAKFIHTLSPVTVYDNHSFLSQVIKKIPAGELVPYNREKRRNKLNWMEIYLDNGQKGYVQKNREEIFLCRHVELLDDEVTGFGYTTTGNSKKDFTSIFSPVIQSGAVIQMAPDSKPVAEVEARRIASREKNRIESITLKYDPAVADVTSFTFRKDETFHVIYEAPSRKDAFILVDNLQGKKGYLLYKTSTSELKDKWIGYLAIVIMILTVAGIIIAFLAAGWLVVGTILIIPGIIIAFVAVIALKIVLSILGAIIHQVRIRL